MISFLRENVFFPFASNATVKKTITFEATEHESSRACFLNSFIRDRQLTHIFLPPHQTRSIMIHSFLFFSR